MKKGIAISACFLWVAGLAMSVIGLNLAGDTGKWIGITGNILFLLGLLLVGILWARGRKKETDTGDRNNNPA